MARCSETLTMVSAVLTTSSANPETLRDSPEPGRPAAVMWPSIASMPRPTAAERVADGCGDDVPLLRALDHGGPPLDADARRNCITRAVDWLYF